MIYDSYDIGPMFGVSVDVPGTMKIDYDSLSDIKTGYVVKTLEDKQVVGGRWVYSKKLDYNNNLTMYKAR